MSRLLARFSPALILPLIVLTGCGAATSFSNPSTSVAFKGKVYGGQQPVVGSTVTVWAAGITGYGSAATPLSSTKSQDDGSFDFSTAPPYTCIPGEQVYITASGGTAVAGGPANPNIMLATGLGDCTAAQTATVEINEVTTAVTAFALAQFFTPTLGASSTDSFGTDPADLIAFTNSNQYLIPTLIDIPSGLVQPNTPSITIEAAKIYSIADTLASCVNDAAGFANCSTLFTDTTVPNERSSSFVPSDTLQAAVQMALRPYQDIHGLYTLASKTPPFTGLSAEPNDWTIGVSYTSPNFALSIAGTGTSATSASIDIDANGKIWFPTNLSGSTGIANFDPTATAFNGPYLTGTVTQPQYVAIDTNGYAWTTDLTSPNLGNVLTTAPATTFNQLVLPVADPLGPIAADGNGYVFFTFIDSNRAILAGDLGEGELTLESSGSAFTYPPTGLAATDGFYGASTSGSSTPCANESLGGPTIPPIDVEYQVTSDNCTSGGFAFAQSASDGLSVASSLNQVLSAEAGPLPLTTVSLPQGIATDGYGHEWVANSGNASVATFGNNFDATPYSPTDSVAYPHDALNGNTMTTPYAIAIDGSGNVWTANAGCVATSTTGCTPGSFVLSELIGVAGPTITPLSSQMVSGGILVGQLPGAVPPVPDASAHAHRYGPAANAQSSAKLWSKTAGKPFVFIR